MKRRTLQATIIALCLLFSASAFSQNEKVDTSYGIQFYAGSGTRLIYSVSQNPVYDTVKVVMLISDTSYYSSTLTVGGYEKREKVFGLTNTYVPFMVVDSYSNIVYWHREYLDNNKQPLKKSIIVWLSKQL